MYGRKHSYRLYTKMLNEAMRWTAAIQGVIDSKTPIETPTLQLIRDIKVKQIPWHVSRFSNLTLLIVRLVFFTSGEQREPGNSWANVQEEPHSQIHPAPSTCTSTAAAVWRGHQLWVQFVTYLHQLERSKYFLDKIPLLIYIGASLRLFFFIKRICILLPPTGQNQMCQLKYVPCILSPVTASF